MTSVSFTGIRPALTKTASTTLKEANTIVAQAARTLQASSGDLAAAKTARAEALKAVFKPLVDAWRQGSQLVSDSREARAQAKAALKTAAAEAKAVASVIKGRQTAQTVDNAKIVVSNLLNKDITPQAVTNLKKAVEYRTLSPAYQKTAKVVDNAGITVSNFLNQDITPKSVSTVKNLFNPSKLGLIQKSENLEAKLAKVKQQIAAAKK